VSSRRRRRARPPRRRLASPLARTTDRVEDLVAWLLVAAGMLAALGAVVVGAAAHRAALVPGQLGEASPVRAVLLADVPVAVTSRRPAVLPDVPVSWTSADGTEQTGELEVPAPLRAGATVTAWLDRNGRLTAAPPTHAAEAAALGLGAGLAVGAGAWALLAALWSSVRRVTAARNDAAWTREWARVEPVWRRQMR
jgi:hypothetical protein